MGASIVYPVCPRSGVTSLVETAENVMTSPAAPFTLAKALFPADWHAYVIATPAGLLAPCVISISV